MQKSLTGLVSKKQYFLTACPVFQFVERNTKEFVKEVLKTRKNLKQNL